jgi:chromosome segregation ATPase
MPKGKPVQKERRKKVISLWLKGLTYRAIKERTGVSIATISFIVSDSIEKEPSLNQIRDLMLETGKNNTSVLECLRGATFLKKINEFHVSLEELDSIIEFCRAAKQPLKVAEAGLEMISLKKETGKGYLEMLTEWEEKNTDLRQAKQDIKKKREKLEKITERLQKAEKLEELQSDLVNLGLSPKNLKKFIDDARKVEQNGFTPKVSTTLSDEMKKHGLAPARAAEKVAEIVAKYGTLQRSINELEKQERAATEKIGELNSVKRSLNQKINEYRETIDERRRIMKNLADRHVQKEKKLESIYEERKTFLTRHINDLKGEITNLKMVQRRIQVEIDNLTGLKGSIKEGLDFVEKLEEKVNLLIQEIKASTEEKEKVEAVIETKEKDIEGLNAWKNYLLSGDIPIYESTFWTNLKRIIQMRDERLPLPYIRQTSEAVRKKMLEFYKGMVSEDIVSTWNYEKLRGEKERVSRNLQEVREKLAKEQKGRYDAESRLDDLEDKWETRVENEVSNRLTSQIQTMKCNSCSQLFWIDKKTENKRITGDYTCPYCMFSYSVTQFPYNIYLFKDKVVILLILTDQKEENILVHTSKEMVTITTKDRAHNIKIPIRGYETPEIVKKTYRNQILKIEVTK